MRRSIVLTILFYFSILLNGATYYVATTGNNSNPGTIGSPWLTWRKAFNTAQPGDTVFFRGGVYYSTEDASGITVDSRYPGESYGCYSGTIDNIICFFNYPGETPILDCRNVDPSGTSYGIMTKYVDYVHYKGLHLRNLWQKGTNTVIDGWANWYDSDSLVYENCTVTSISGQGFYSVYGNSVHYINCDASYCIDSTSNTPGQYGTGFNIDNRDDYAGRTISNNSRFYFKGCRAWKCSDQGYAGRPWGYVNWENCWSFSHGAFLGDGHGFKPSSPDAYQTVPTLQRRFVNCIAACNSYSGWSTNESYTRAAARMKVFNCFSYHNGYKAKGSISGIGYWMLVTSASGDPLTRILRNNIAYDNEQYTVYSAGTTYTHTYNSWDNPPNVTVTVADFQSLDTLQLWGNRQADGSLPNITFGRLASTSDCIDAGTDVGLSYDGAAPDLGWAEYEATGAEPVVLTLTSVYAATTSASVNCNVIDDGGGTISARGVVWSTDANPDLTDNVVTVSGTTGTYVANITGLTQGTTYHVRAYATNEVGTSYYPSTGDTEFTTKTSGSGGVFRKYGGKFVFYNGKWIRL